MKTKASSIYLTGLAIVFAVALTYLTLEIPIYLNNILVEHLNIPDYNPAITPDLIEEFIVKYNLRPIGYSCLAIVVLLVIVGFVTRKNKISALGSVLLFLPTFGYFVAYMFFLSGLGIIRLMWIPLWGISLDIMRLGDLVYLPYMLITYPFGLLLSIFTLEVDSPFFRFFIENRLIHYHLGGLHPDLRVIFALLMITLGLLIFIRSTAAWFITNYSGNKVADFWLYKYSRHPQYLGWLIWSYGVMVYASLTPVVRGGANPGASLPWMLSSLIIICVALNEEIQMIKSAGEEYIKYREKTPFLLPIPRIIGDLIKYPFKRLMKKKNPENIREIFAFFLIYTTIIILMSLPFVLLNWPSPMGWGEWPYMLWPFN